MKSHFFPNRVFRRLDLATGLSREFKPQANGLASLRLLSYSAIVGATLQLLACLAREHHLGGLQLRVTRKIQPRVPISLHNLEQFLTLSHTLPLHDSHLNTGLLIPTSPISPVISRSSRPWSTCIIHCSQLLTIWSSMPLKSAVVTHIVRSRTTL